MSRECLLKHADDGKAICSRSACRQPPIKVPIRKSTGEPWPLHMIHRVCTAPAGLGDYVAKAIETLLPWTKKKKCEPCAKRQQMLNELGRKITG